MMNDKLRSILRTAWNEPRHFFFWLAMLSICGFIAAAGAAALTSPTRGLSFIALGSVVGFLVSIPAFVLAWIPPIRRLFSWLLCHRFLALGCLLTLVALFYAIEDWRGRRAWQNYKRVWEAKGERFDWASFIPPPVPSDQNFFESPLWDDLHFVRTNGSVVWSATNRQERVLFSVYGPKDSDAPGTGDWIKAQRVDLAAWQTFYRGSNNLFAAQSGPSTNYFPVANEAQTPAADVLLALSRFNENRQLLLMAAARPQARFWVNYEDGFFMLLPHLVRLKGSSRYLSLHASAALTAGDRGTALEDLKLLFRLIESVRRDPTVIAHLVRVAILNIALQPVWEGLADRQWTEADLSVIESELGKLDFLADYHFALRGERACCNVLGVDYFRKGGVFAVVETDAASKASWPFDLEQLLGVAAFQLIPSGWFDQNKLSLCLMHEKCLLPLVDKDRRVVPPAANRRTKSTFEKQRMRPYDVFSKLLLSSLVGISEKCARGQSCADFARVACALERYRLANGQFPDTLEVLAPKFIEKLPHDIINGQSLKYRLTNDGQFVLYSVGWNETDEGGTVGLTKNGKPDPRQGDWVWRYPPR